ncbi:putative periplasmic serine endoprotease DegP-like precursor [bacterium BMS3Bbin07]|nr:putative periplasmic serine endoprotease DegP-like precursor [bacterium BMS3Bbin07]HDH01828.1 DegQ family serine endoprotease [Nitrospirota bacterium]
MKKKILFGLLTLLIGFLIGGLTYYSIYERVKIPQRTVYTPPLLSQKVVDTSRAFAEIVEAVSPSVVNISTKKTVRRERSSIFNDPFFDFINPFQELPRKWKEQSLGSGVIVSADGYIITNNHVVDQADEIKVTLYDRRTLTGKVVGADPKTDLALVKINVQGLPTVPWGDAERLKVGEFVLAIGNPFGLSHTVTMGIVSAVGRANVGIADYEDFIQTDAAINPGNSGGPLVNIQGELVGINTAIFSRSGGYQGIGFAVPSNMVRSVMEQLRKEGKVIRGWLGVTIQDMTPELAEKFGLKTTAGALVSDVFKDSPAQKAGIKRGDVITQYNGKAITSVSTLRNMVARSKVGSEVEITVVRNSTQHKFRVVVNELPTEFSEVSSAIPEEKPDDVKALAGITITELTGSIAKQLGIDQSEKGVVVLDIEAGSAAQEAGIKKGDVIQEIDRKRIYGIDDWKKIVSGIKPDEMVVMFLNRGGRKFYVALKP